MTVRYRQLGVSDFQRAMSFCEQHKINFDLWNAEDVWFADAELAEFGVEERWWPQLDAHLSSAVQ